MYRILVNLPDPVTLHWKQADCPSDVTASRSGITTAGGYTGTSSSGETTSGTKGQEEVVFEEDHTHVDNLISQTLL